MACSLARPAARHATEYHVRWRCQRCHHRGANLMTPTGVRRERHVVSTGRVDNSREVIVDAQLYRLSRASSEWRHSQQPCFDVLLVDTGIPIIRIWFLNFAGPRFTRFTYYNLFSILLCISLVNWSKIESLKTEFAETFLICRYEFSSDWDTIINN